MNFDTPAATNSSMRRTAPSRPLEMSVEGSTPRVEAEVLDRRHGFVEGPRVGVAVDAEDGADADLHATSPSTST
jgi:hypothetical protein